MFELMKSVKVHEWFIWFGMVVITNSFFMRHEDDIKIFAIFGAFLILIGMVLSKFEIKLIIDKIREFDAPVMEIDDQIEK